MMRRHEHVATVRVGCYEPGQRLPFEVASEEHPSARRFDGEHETRFVVACGMGCRCHFVPLQIATPDLWVQDANPAEWIERERIACLCGPHSDSCHSRLPQQLCYRPRLTHKKGGRHDDLSNSKSLEQFRHGIEVICVGMRDDERIDPRDTLMPENGRHGTPGC